MVDRQQFTPNAPGRRERAWKAFIKEWKREAEKKGYRPHSGAVRAVLKLARNIGEFNIALADFVAVHGSSRPTASRELRKMIEAGLLKKEDAENGSAKFSLTSTRDGTYRTLWDYWNLTYKR